MPKKILTPWNVSLYDSTLLVILWGGRLNRFRFGRCNMAHSPNSTTRNTDTSHSGCQLEIHLEELDFVDSAVIQAEINLIEHYFQDILISLAKGSPP